MIEHDQLASQDSGCLHSRSAEETTQFGRRLAAVLEPGDLVALNGDLGAGKTCMIQGIAAGLGVTDVVNSPTFVLLNQYSAAARLHVHHFDLYRLSSNEELEDIGAVEFFHDPQGVSLVEWADRMPQMLPTRHWEIRLEHGTTPTERKICWRRPDDQGQGRKTE